MSGNAISNSVLLRRIDALEKRIAALAPANRITSATNRAGGVPPKPTDLSVILTPGLAHLTWTGSRSSDLLTYLVEVSLSPDFVGVEEYEESSTRFIYSNGVEGLTYYARVFALNGARARSDASGTVTFVIGASSGSSVTSTQVAISRFVNSAGPFTTLNTNNESQTFGPCTFSLNTAASRVKPIIVLEGRHQFIQVNNPADNCYLLIELLRRPVGGATDTIVKTQRHFWSVDLTDQDVPIGIPVGSPFETPGSGNFEYRLRLTTREAGTNEINFQAGYVAIEALVLQ